VPQVDNRDGGALSAITEWLSAHAVSGLEPISLTIPSAFWYHPMCRRSRRSTIPRRIAVRGTSGPRCSSRVLPKTQWSSGSRRHCEPSPRRSRPMCRRRLRHHQLP